YTGGLIAGRWLGFRPMGGEASTIGHRLESGRHPFAAFRALTVGRDARLVTGIEHGTSFIWKREKSHRPKVGPPHRRIAE
ncbi:MAG: hypothetical protein ACK5NQ_14790, partial [Pseudomonas sp.]